MKKSTLRKRYGKRIKGLLLIINIFLLLLTIRMYVHYGHILETTRGEKRETFLMKQDEAYQKNFEQKYAQSIYAPYFKGHENNTLYDKEFLVHFTTKHVITKKDLSEEPNTSTSSKKNTPKQERNTIFKRKISRIEW